MPRSRYAMSALTPSSASARRPCSKSARMKRVVHWTSAASSANAFSASGSRSIAISGPAGPRRAATRRAWPAAPRVQSIAIWTRPGSSASMSSPARTGTCVRGMSSRMAKRCGEVRRPLRQVAVVGLPGRAVPELEAVAGAGDNDLAVDARVLEVAWGQHHAAGRVQLRVGRVPVEHPLELARLRGERVHPLQRGLGQRRVGGLGIQGYAGIRPPDEEHPAGQGRPEASGDRQPVLGVERVFEGAVKGQGSCLLAKEVQSIPGGGVGGAPPPGTGFASATYPTLSHSATQITSFAPLDLNLVTLQTRNGRVC